MTIESHRKRLLDNPRRWGEQVPDVPHAGLPPRTRENFDPPTALQTDSTSDHHGPRSLAPPDPPPDPPANFFDPALQIPIPPNSTMISTKGWTLDSLINRSINFHRVPRVSALSGSLPQYLNDHEKSGVPLVIEDCHEHPNWNKDEFTLDSFASATSDEIVVRNVHNWQDTVIPLSDFITKSRSIATFAEEGEQERFYGKDAPCPKRWEEWLRKAGVVPQSLLSGGPQDFFRYRPSNSPVETLMCYLGVGDTFTPCHKDLCSSSGQNLMCHTENNGSSFWFMTETASAPEVAKFFHSLGRELDHEDYVITVEELSKARFKVYILEQKLGDLVLVPPRSAHQVVNVGGITVKTSWSRMTLKGLVAAYHHELPIYRRACRLETYRVKSTIRYVLLGLTNDLQKLLHINGQEYLASNIRELLVVFDHILAEEESDIHTNDPSPDEVNENIVCDFCGADIFQGFFECRTCVEADSAEGGYAVCPGCYAEGRSCKHQLMQPMQRRPFQSLLDTRTAAIQVVDTYERRYGRSFQLSNDYCDSYPRTFRAALVLLDIYKKMKSLRVCTLRGSSHVVSFSCALACKMCHHAKCFSHILSEHRTHSIEALLLHNCDDTHQKYHYSHSVGRKARFEIDAVDLINSPLEHQQLVYYAIHFTHCKPIKPQFMKLGWYDANVQMSYVSDDQEPSTEIESTLVPAAVGVPTENVPIAVQPPINSMPGVGIKRTMKRKAETGLMLVPDTTVSVSTGNGPLTVQPPTNTIEITVKRTKKNRAYVLVPRLPYRYRLSDQHSDIHQRGQVDSSTSALSVTGDEVQHTINGHEPRVPSLQVQLDCAVPKAPTILKPSTLSLSDIGISIPTTVRKPGSFIIHTPQAIPRNKSLAEETVFKPLVESVKPSITRPFKPLHIANPVTAQVITKGSLFPFNRSHPSKLSSTTVASTSIQGGSSLPRPQPPLPPLPFTPMPLSDANALSSTELTPLAIAEAVIHRFGSMLCQNTSSPGQVMNSSNASSNSNGGAQTPYSYNGQHSGPPPQYNEHPHHYDLPQHNSSPRDHRPPQQHTGQSLHYNGPSQHYGPSPQHNGQRPQYNGPPEHYVSPPHFNSHEDNSHIPYSRVHPQRLSRLSYHAPLHPTAKQPQFYQDNRRFPQKQTLVQSANDMRYMNHQSQDHHHNGRTKMPGKPLWSKQHPNPNKKRKYNGPPDSRFNYATRPRQGPRDKYYNVVPTHPTYQPVEYHDGMERSTSRDHVRSPWGTSSEGTPSTNYQSQSEYFQNEVARGRQGHYCRQRYPETGSLEPKIEESTQDQVPTQNRTNNGDSTMDDVTDVDSNDVIRLETPLPMADLTILSPEIEEDDGLYPNDSVMGADDVLHEAGTSLDNLDNLPVPAVGDQRSDQDWEDNYAIEEPTTEVLPAPQSTSQSQLASANADTLDSIFNVADDSMADVTANPWTSL